LAAWIVLTAPPALAQRGLIQEGYREFPAAPSTLTAPAPTTEDIVAARGNLQRWRDAERARIGPYVRENEIENARLRSAYQSALATQSRRRARDREPVEAPTYLPVGPTLPAVGGYFAYFYEAEGVPRRTVVAAIWRDRRTNAGEPSTAGAAAMLPDAFCANREIALADLAYLGPVYTPEIAALNRDWLGALAGPPVLSGAELAFTRTPAGALFARYYPERALAREMEGSSYMLCDIGAAGLTCAVTWEDPPGWGFGEAALKIAAEGYRVAPELVGGGSAIGRKVCLGTAFRLQ
jgi:hypothetical protein